jgi:hypothetical protein
MLARHAGPSWIARKVAELGALLRKLPDDRQRECFATLNAPGSSSDSSDSSLLIHKL